MNSKKIKFATDTNQEFAKMIRLRANGYFTENNISKYANSTMIIKTIIILLLYFVPYGFIVSGFASNVWVLAAMWILMGFGMAGIGMGIMHDANHGSYSKNKMVNKIISFTIEIVGGNAETWQIQHNGLHHSYTNVTGMDEDIDPGVVLRFSPHDKHRWFYKFQHIYAWFFYGLMTVLWSTVKDFNQIIRYNKMNLLSSKQSFSAIFTKIVIFKVLYYAYALVLPLMFSPLAWWLTLSFYFVMHFIAGFILGIVFQPAHVMPSSEYPMPNTEGVLEDNWAVHQLRTTTDFSHKNNLFSWYVGGLNYQIEHHLFPGICHVHYPKLAEIVKETAAEFGIQYNMQKNFALALLTHGKMLKQLGKA